MSLFEVLAALRELDRATPEYFKREIFFMARHSTVRIEAIAILGSLEGDGCGVATLCSLIKVTGE